MWIENGVSGVLKLHVHVHVAYLVTLILCYAVIIGTMYMCTYIHVYLWPPLIYNTLFFTNYTLDCWVSECTYISTYAYTCT